MTAMRSSSTRGPRGRTGRKVFAAIVLTAFCTAPAWGQSGNPDFDEDGVVDTSDACPDSQLGELVDARGCSVCPCDRAADGSAWESRDAYVRCVATEARARRGAGTLRPSGVRAAIRQAQRSTCGDVRLTRCCVFEDFMDDVGSCRIVTPAACQALDERTWEGDAEDEGIGSCLPNPCVF
jgi:hypothetical protein